MEAHMLEQSDVNELRLRRLEQLTTTMVESQASMVQIQQEQSNRLDRIEKLLELALDDLAFIKEFLKRDGDSASS